MHLRALAAAAASVSRRAAADVGPAPSWPRGCGRRTRTCPPGAWLRAVGYHESVAGALDRHVLDRLLPRRPVRVQHRTGALWMVNSLAAARLGLDGCELSGVERDEHGPPDRAAVADGPLARRPGAGRGRDLGAVSRKAAALGITGFTDATPGATDGDLAFPGRSADRAAPALHGAAAGLARRHRDGHASGR